MKCQNVPEEPRYLDFTYLESFDLSLFRAQLLAPHRLRLSEGLDAGLELVDLLPAKVELLAHVGQLVGVPLVCILDAFLELCLNVTESFQTHNEVVVEDGEVRERLCFSLTVLLLLRKTERCTSVMRALASFPEWIDTHRSLVDAHDLVHVLVDRQEQRIALR